MKKDIATKLITTFSHSLVFLLAALFSFSAFSDVKILSEKNEKVDLKFRAGEGFATVQNKYRVYSAQIIIEDPSLKDVKEVRIEGGEVVSVAEGKILFTFGAYNGNLEIENKAGQIKKYNVSWAPVRKGIALEKCPMQSAKIFSADPKQALTFPLGQSCDTQANGRLFITISAPQEVRLADSSIIEVAGKGERWRYFEVPAAGTMGGIVAKYNYTYNNVTYPINLITPKEMTAAAKEELKQTKELVGSRFQNTFGAGPLALSFAAGATSGSDSPIGFRYSGLSQPFFDSFRVGGVAKMGMTSSSATGISFTDIKGTLGYYKNSGENLMWGLYGEYMYMSFGQSSSSLQLQSMQLGVGTSIDYYLNKSNRLLVFVDMAYFGSTVLTSHLETNFEYRYKMGTEKSPWWLGFNYDMQSFAAVNTSGAARTFGENAMSFIASF